MVAVVRTFRIGIVSLAAACLLACGLDQEGGNAAPADGGTAGSGSTSVGGGSAGIPSSGGGAGGSSGFPVGGAGGSAGDSGASGGAGLGGGSAGVGGGASGSGGATGGSGGSGGATGGSGGTGGATGGSGGTGGVVTKPSCASLYSGKLGVLQLCTGTATECRLYIDNDPSDGDPGQSCTAICAEGGGECLKVYDDSGTCTADTNDERNCNITTMSNAMCYCSWGCGSGLPCDSGRVCTNGVCV